jgi:carbonic anhydrase
MTPFENPEKSPMRKPLLNITRRQAVAGLGLATAAASVTGLATWWSAHRPLGHHGFSLTTPNTADEALVRLRAGNECYVAEHFEVGNRARTTTRRAEVAPTQHPYAIVLACADSRVPPEIIFSAGLGDLFVVRVAGNIVDPKCLGVLGSIEYAIEELKIPLVFVLGHEGCGAVKAAIHAVENGIKPPGAIGVLTDAIRPAVERIRSQTGDLLQNAVSSNVRRQIDNLLRSAAIVAPAVASRKLQIAGGVYELSTGRVRLLSD